MHNCTPDQLQAYCTKQKAIYNDNDKEFSIDDIDDDNEGSGNDGNDTNEPSEREQ